MGIMRRQWFLRLLGLMGFVAILLTGCSGGGETPGGSGQSRLTIRLVTAEQTPAGATRTLAQEQVRQVQPGDRDFLTRIDVRVEAADLSDPIRKSMPLSANEQTRVTVNLLVPKGNNRRIIVSLFNASGEEVFYGESLPVDLTQDVQTVELFVSPTAPTVTNPGNQQNTEGDTVSLQIVATDVNNDTLTYSATDLPPALAMNSETGLISGTIASGAAAGSPYNVTVAVSDGTHTTSINFTWTVELFVPPNTVRIDSPPGPVTTGTQFTVPVILNPGEIPVVSYLFDLTFDPAVIQITDIEAGEFPFDTIVKNTTFAPGTARFAAHASTFDPAMNADLTLARVTFQVVGNPGDTTTLSLTVPSDVGVLVNNSFEAINLEEIAFEPGLVTVQ